MTKLKITKKACIYRANSRRHKMAFGRVLERLAVVALLVTNVVLGADYILTGTVKFGVERGEQLTVRGYYKYCLASTNCPTCLRQIYLNLFTKSVCLASIGRSKLDCKKYHFSRTFTAPSTAGLYSIKMEEKLDYTCQSNRVSSSGRTVGTVTVQEPPSIVNKTSSPTVFTGDSLNLSCSARGYPPPVLRWYKDGHFVHENTSLQFSSLTMSNSGLYMCNTSNIAGSDTYEVQVLVRERRPLLNQEISFHNADKLLQNDSVTFTVSITHDVFSKDHAWNVVLVWILPHYALFLSHEPKTNVSSSHPGEYYIGIGQIQLVASTKINIRVQIDPGGELSAGHHFLTIPTYTMYEQRMAGSAAKIFVGSMESVTVNFIVKEGGKRSFLMHPLSSDVYFCQTKTSDQQPSCHVSTDGIHWSGIDPRVKSVTGMIVRGFHKKIFGMTSDNRCHVVSGDDLIWRCIASDEWQKEISSSDFMGAILVPRDLKSEIPQNSFTASKSDGTITFGASAKGLHKKQQNGMWHLVALWDCP